MRERCVHIQSVSGYEVSLLEARFAALRGDASRWASEAEAARRRAGPCATCGLDRLARGDDLMACLHCNYVGCWSPFRRRRGVEGRHIQWHLVRCGHAFAVHLERFEVYCQRCGDFVYDRAVPAALKEKEPERKGSHGWMTRCLEGADVPSLTAITSRPEERQHHGLRGFHNMGNTCFMSCILQVLVHSPPFQAFFLHGGHERCGESTCLACEMATIFAAVFDDDEKADDAVVPHRMLYATWKVADRLAGYEQQDAHEFLMVLLDALAKRVDAGKNRGLNFIREVFCGSLRSDVVCAACGATSSTREPFLDLSLALDDSAPLKLEECLDRFTSPEMLPETTVCEACGRTVSRSKQLTVEKLPNVLVIHLKRFDARKDRKITEHLDFPPACDLGPHLSPFRNSAATPPPKHAFTLWAVVNHSGADVARGHYTCYVHEGGKWFVCDDTKVNEVDFEEVHHSEGYILFYVRTDLARIRPSTSPAGEKKKKSPLSSSSSSSSSPRKKPRTAY
ncbi:hypothetical protein CTAYLR_009947 [Chrysophaeum taylorii]|uniref:Ubiquitin carboxyl-terminal hydrolase n=1 Tax=Chrysophaeum taylorii TaxID=2483200 RepID=A0AAD7UKE8_9STRA|nr:hypothetical protein CTAYLR_009947 [Chrysophaeum taylorii]